jgi:allophanate hydrolase subunit 1
VIAIEAPARRVSEGDVSVDADLFSGFKNMLRCLLRLEGSGGWKLIGTTNVGYHNAQDPDVDQKEDQARKPESRNEG